MEATNEVGNIREEFSKIAQHLDQMEELLVSAYCGDSTQGYLWETTFLPNGTLLRLKYEGNRYLASVAHGGIRFNGLAYTPSSLVLLLTGERGLDPWNE